MLAVTALDVYASGGVKSLDDLRALGAIDIDGRRIAGCHRRGVVRRLAKCRSKRRWPCATVRIIPCLDVTHGRVVKGVRFVDLIDAGDPAELAHRYSEEGVTRWSAWTSPRRSKNATLWSTSLSAPPNSSSSRSLSAAGFEVKDDARRILAAGADKVAINSAALAHPALIAELAATFGCQCVVVAIDAKRRDGRFEVYTHGGGRSTGVDAVSWAVIAERLGAGGESCSRRWTATARSSATTANSCAPSRRRARTPLVASGGAGISTTCSKGAHSGADA